MIKLKDIYSKVDNCVPLRPVCVDFVFKEVIRQRIKEVIVDEDEMFSLIIYFTATAKGEIADWALHLGKLDQIFGVKLILK